MRTSKSMLAGVAAGALALGFLSVAGAASASAAPKAKPKATATATVSAVRSTVGGTISIPEAKAGWTGAGAFVGNSNANIVDLIVAPSSAASMIIDDTTGSGNVSATLSSNAVGVGVGSGDDSSIRFNVDQAGTYSGIIANGTDTVSFSFSTAGAPTSMTLTPASQTVAVGAVATVRVTLKDASGNTTQPQTVDSVTVASNGSGDVVGTTPLTGVKGGALQYGVFDDTIATSAAGTSTITATPLGTLPGSGVTAQTATITKSGGVTSVPAKSVKVTVPAGALSTPPNTDDTVDRSVQVVTGTSALSIVVDDTTGNAAGSSLRFKLTPSAGGTVTVNGQSGSNTSPLFVDVTTNADRRAEILATLSGNALLSGGGGVNIKQVSVLNANLTAGSGVTVAQTDATGVITVSPDDSVVAKLGDTLAVTATVTDQFGNPQSGWTVRAYRGATTSGTFLNQATTGALGKADVSVAAASGATAPALEQYSFSATPSVGSAVNGNNLLQVTWTADGKVTSLSVVSTPVTSPTPVDDTAVVVSAPLVTVPFDGSASSVTGQSFTVATGADISGGAAGEVASFIANPSTPTTVVASVGLGATGIFVSTTPTTAWNAGQSTVTVNAGAPVYVFGTKAGVHNITFAAGGRTVTIPVKVKTSAAAAYNMALTPETQSVNPGSINTVTLTVTDVFGNPVQTTDDTGKVTVTASGEILLAGYQTSASYNTGANGTATITVIAGNVGTGVLAAGPATSNTAPAWVAGYTKPTGAPDPKTSAAAEVIVTGVVEQSIAIVGSRGSADVSLPSDETCRSYAEGPPPRALPSGCITVDGVTTGFDEGSAMTPEYRFPGQTSYTAGIDVTTNADGEFNWYRKTGKKIYVRFMSGDVVSSRVIIPAK